MAPRDQSRRMKAADRTPDANSESPPTPAPRPARKPTRPRAAAADRKSEVAEPAEAASVDPSRLALLEQIVEAAGQLCGLLARSPGQGLPAPAANAPGELREGETRLRQFLKDVKDLRTDECRQVAEAAENVLETLYVHLPLKRAMHAVDPIQRLRVLRRRVEGRSARAFHAEMISIFHSLRDLHTSYVLPASYQGVTAFLPFLIEKCHDPKDAEGQDPRYLVTKVREDLAHLDFGVGVRVTHWNGIPIDRAVEIIADREAGSNDDAREARGLEALTLRPLALTAPPDEEWVVIGYESKGRALEIRFDWSVFTPPPSPSGIQLAGQAVDQARIGVDVKTEEVRRAKKLLFAPAKLEVERQMLDPAARERVRATAAPVMAPAPGAFRSAAPGPPSMSVLGVDALAEHVRLAKKDLYAPGGEVALPGLEQAEAPSRAPSPVVPSFQSTMPDVFEFRIVPVPDGDMGYVRIFTFMVTDADAFVEEFSRIASFLPARGLILDVRGNGGGNILAGERLLQVLTPRPIEPARFQFINSETTRQLCNSAPAGFELTRWASSIGMAVESGEVYSQGFSLQSVEDANRVGQRYQGPVVLITDALCYSTTDIFAAGFQDHRIGQILGTGRRTGAGGANVWQYDLLSQLLPKSFPNLPGGASLHVAIRRSTRVGDRFGVPVEDFGVEPDEIHLMTEDDVLNGNVDLVRHAAGMLAKETPHLLSARIDATRPGGPVMEVTATNVSRVDIYQDGRPIATRNLEDGSTQVVLAGGLNLTRPLTVRGFEHDKLVASAAVRA